MQFCLVIFGLKIIGHGNTDNNVESTCIYEKLLYSYPCWTLQSQCMSLILRRVEKQRLKFVRNIGKYTYFAGGKTTNHQVESYSVNFLHFYSESLYFESGGVPSTLKIFKVLSISRNWMQGWHLKPFNDTSLIAAGINSWNENNNEWARICKKAVMPCLKILYRNSSGWENHDSLSHARQ
jgi:hypothetical protein